MDIYCIKMVESCDK